MESIKYVINTYHRLLCLYVMFLCKIMVNELVFFLSKREIVSMLFAQINSPTAFDFPRFNLGTPVVLSELLS